MKHMHVLLLVITPIVDQCLEQQTFVDGANDGARSSTNIVCHGYQFPPDHPKVDVKVFFTGSTMFQAAEVEVFRVLV